MFAFDAPQQDAESIRLRVRFRGDTLTVPLTRALLTVAHETSLSVGREFFALSKAGFRCEVHGVKSAVETLPLPGSTVEVQLRAKYGTVHKLYEGKTGDDGQARAEMKVPKLPTGETR